MSDIQDFYDFVKFEHHISIDKSSDLQYVKSECISTEEVVVVKGGL